MTRLFSLVITLLICFSASGQVAIRGLIIDRDTRMPIEGATITLLPGKASTFTDASGRFFLKSSQQATTGINIYSIGYSSRRVGIDELLNTPEVTLDKKEIELQDVVVIANAGNQFRLISQTDISMRGISNSQEVLRIVPGLVIGQHQGGGKAEQIFLRGFDADHGTDLRLDVDGIPINMVSHAHGQGFADSHFIIPETIEQVDFRKGPYATQKGDFATAGSVDFSTNNMLSGNQVKLETGMFNTHRLLGMFNLLPESAMQKQQSWYVASEYRYSNAYFDFPQHFNRFNLFTKYRGRISTHTMITASATAFWSKWDASGQIPGRAVDQGIIGFYGAIDPNEGGLTYRTNINLQSATSFANGALLKNQVYYSNARFDLYSNFTLFLVDTVNGDEIRQQETRNMLGYNGSYRVDSYVAGRKLLTEAGLNVRADGMVNSGLSHTLNRHTTLGQFKLGDIAQLNIAPYINESFQLNEQLELSAGIRYDRFYHQYKNKLSGDSSFPGIGKYRAGNGTLRLSPKLNLNYHVNQQTQLYLSAGKGFHSNDTRGVVVANGLQSLPAAMGSDLGTIFKPVKNLLINAAAWYIDLEQEFVYSGDGGSVDFSGRTRRIGLDFSGRYQPRKWLYLDLDVNYAHGRSRDAVKGEDYIPLAPVWTSTGGITFTNKSGFNGSLRYRYTGKRAGNENYSLEAESYFITDLVVNYSKPRYELGIVINNVLNRQWKETQFDTVTRLPHEVAPVDEICFTPGTPFAAKLSIAYFFK